MADGNMEKFIIDLGFSDKEAVKGLQNFLKKVEQVKVNVKPKAVIDQTLKREQAANKILEKQDAARIAKKTKLEMDHLVRVRRFEQSKNFRMLSGGDPDRARNLSKDFTSRSDTLRRQQMGGASPRSLDATARSMNNLKDSVDRASSAMRRQKRVAMGLSTAQRGLADSTRNMVRTYASVFAVFEGVRAVNKTGQDFEALNSAMLAAMGTEKEAAKQIAFLDRLTSRLGMSLIDTADQYTKFTFAAKGKLPTEEVNFLFQSMAEMGTVLGVSKERMKLSFTAIQQMMNKSTISSEELLIRLAA